MYYDAVEVQKRGEPIFRHGDRQPRVPPGRRLIGVLDNRVRKIAVDVTSPAEFQAFYRSYYRGAWLTYELRLLTSEELQECPDKDP